MFFITLFHSIAVEVRLHSHSEMKFIFRCFAAMVAIGWCDGLVMDVIAVLAFCLGRGEKTMLQLENVKTKIPRLNNNDKLPLTHWTVTSESSTGLTSALLATSACIYRYILNVMYASFYEWITTMRADLASASVDYYYNTYYFSEFM